MRRPWIRQFEVKRVASHTRRMIAKDSILSLYSLSNPTLSLRRSIAYQKIILFQPVACKGVG